MIVLNRASPRSPGIAANQSIAGNEYPNRPNKRKVEKTIQSEECLVKKVFIVIIYVPFSVIALAPTMIVLAYLQLIIAVT
jgi:hypothetical protein